VKSWDLDDLNLKPRLPEILSSSEDARVIALDLAAGESLEEHEVHERAFLLVLAGEITLSGNGGGDIRGGQGLLVEIEPRERHRVEATADARLLLLLTPWPGNGHPGAMELREKLYTRRHAAKRGAE
jgi:quercetin dioxygenase-like cupin family protein